MKFRFLELSKNTNIKLGFENSLIVNKFLSYSGKTLRKKYHNAATYGS